MNFAKLEAAQIIPRVLRYLPSPSLQDEGMVTAHRPPEEANRVETMCETPEEATTEEQHSKVIRRRRRIWGIRFISIMRPMQRSRKRAVARMATSTTQRKEVPRLQISEVFHWDEERDPICNVSAPVTPLSINQPSIAREPEQTHQEMEGLREELASLRLLVQRLQLAGPQSEPPSN